MFYLVTFIIFEVIVAIPGLSLYPDHNKPCVPNDAWTEDCRKCVCTDERVVVCQPTYCASTLYQENDKCEYGTILVEGCNVCTCVNEFFLCQFDGCSDDSQ